MEYYKILDLADIKYFCEEDLIWKYEQWKDVVGFEGDYNVSDLGRFKSKRYHNGTNERIIKQKITKKNYLHITLYKNKIPSFFSAHRLVAIAFIPNPENKQDVNHKGLYPDGREGNKLDNRSVSLEWATRSENIAHSFSYGLSSNKGIKHSQAKLTEKDVLEIRSSKNTNEELSKLYNVSSSHICTIRKKRVWKHI